MSAPTPIEAFNGLAVGIEEHSHAIRELKQQQLDILWTHFPTMAFDVVVGLMEGKLKLVDSFGLALVEPVE